MHHLRFLTGISDKADDSTVSPTTDSCHSPQATPLTVRLENRMHLVWLELTAVVDCVKGISKGLLAGRAEVALAPFTSFSVFMGLFMTAEYAGHSFRGQS